LPNEDLKDGEFRARLKNLPNKLEEKMRVDKNSLGLKLGRESQNLRMARNIQEFPVLNND